MSVLGELEPKQVFHFFEQLCSIPHGTFDTGRISAYCVEFAEKRGLPVKRDAADNVIITKPGTAGYENSEPVILQGHIDMVCEKAPGSVHDFSKDSLTIYIEDGCIKAKDTTLGADNGIAVAMIMAVLDSSIIAHPPIEAVFTADEEIGMGGAMKIDLSALKGKMLINIDSEEEGVLIAGCAGGFRFDTVIPVERVQETGSKVVIKIHGPCGGHSGFEIIKGRGNAHKMMGRLLNRINSKITCSLIAIGGGTKDNVISRECTAEIMTASKDTDTVKALVQEMLAVWNAEFMGDEPNLTVDVTISEGINEEVCSKDSTKRVLSYLGTVPNGVQCQNRKIKGLAETSLNLGIIETSKECIWLGHLVRSSMESKKQELKEILSILAEQADAQTSVKNEYPAWMYKEDSRLRKIMTDVYQEMFQKQAEVTMVHAGVECGLFLGKKGDLDCVSFGPDMFDVHSYNERLDIASTARSFEYLKEILKNCK